MSAFQLRHWCDLSASELDKFNKSKLSELFKSHFMRSSPAIAYYLEYLGPNFSNRSVFLIRDSEPVLVVPAICRENELNFAEGPTEILSTLKGEEHHNAVKILTSQLKHIKIRAKLTVCSIFLRESLSSVEQLSISYLGWVNLALSEEMRRRCIRKSYKSLLNWGQNNLDITIVDSANKDLEAFKAFRELHHKASSRKTRSDKSWDLQYDMIVSGNAYLVNACKKGALVSGCYIMHDDKNAYYGVSANDRELMAKGLAINHFPLWKAIDFAVQKRCEKFLLGDVGIENCKEEKTKNISKFKRGFATDITTENIFTFDFG